ncbi:kinase-like domain-containing protein [Obelidium mucronatum]|nr:kinase-like domain-containing protein [Obelidium mucronatum]
MSNAYKDNVWFIPATDVIIDKAKPLGKGSFGEVYTGYYGAIPVAIKTITGLDNPKAVQMAKSEAALWYTLRHPNITPLYGVSVDDHGNPMLIMERAETSLYSRLKCANGEEPVSKEVKMRWILQIAEAFKYLHAQKNPVIHGDLNPRNVLLGYDGVAKITDFGLSRCLLASNSFSRQGQGTWQYSPPESFGRRYKAKTDYDVYSFAMTCYDILTGVQPFNDAHIAESEPDQVPEDSWEWLLIQACWDQDPTKRPSFEEIVKTILEHSDLLKLGRPSFSLSESFSSLSVSPNVPARTSALSKENTETTLAEASTLAAAGKSDSSEQAGTEVPQDYSKAFELLSKATHQGNVGAHANLGVMYANGPGSCPRLHSRCLPRT